MKFWNIAVSAYSKIVDSLLKSSIEWVLFIITVAGVALVISSGMVFLVEKN